MEFILKPFPFDQIGNENPSYLKHNAFIIVGESFQANQHLIKDLLEYHKDIPAGIVITSSEKKPFYEEMIPSCFIHTIFSKKITENIQKRQSKLFSKRNEDPEIDRRMFVIFDCFEDHNWQKDKKIRWMLELGRTFSIVSIFIFPKPIRIIPQFYACFDFLFLLKEHLIPNEDSYKNYCQMISKDVYEELMNQLDLHEYLVLHLYTRNDDLDSIFYYKGVQKPPFKLFSEEVWQMNDQIEIDQMESI